MKGRQWRMKTAWTYIIEHDETGERHEGIAKDLAAIINVVPASINKAALEGKKISGHWKAWKKPKVTPIKTEVKLKCPNCGKMFVKIKKEQFCCSSECSRRFGTKKLQEEMRENTKIKMGKERKPKPKPKQSVTDIAVAARKAGMSYGQYVARMGL